MICLYSGTPGSGKSLHLAQVLSEAYAENRPIVTNFPLNRDNLDKATWLKKHNTSDFLYLDNSELNPFKLYEYSRFVFSRFRYKEGLILLVIDECQLIFNSREWGRQDRQAWLTFFTQHRKLGYEIILVAQFDRMIDRQLRSLIENEYNHRQVKSFGKYMKFVPFSKNCFCVVEYYYPLHERLSASFFVKQKKYYSIYDTNFMFNT